jgi:hypothetical protein
MWTRGIVGVILILVGAVWIAQGTNAIHGSGMMNGRGGYAVLGGIVAVVGLVLLGWAWRIRGHRTS